MLQRSLIDNIESIVRQAQSELEDQSYGIFQFIHLVHVKVIKIIYVKQDLFVS